MSDAGQDPTLSDNEANDQPTSAENAEGGSPLNTVEENELEDDEDDLFGDGGDDADADANGDGNGEDAQAYVATKGMMQHPIDVS